MADQKPAIAPGSEGVPHMDVLDRVMRSPVVQSAIEKTGSTYAYLKDSHNLMNWALSHAETGLHNASAAADSVTSSLAKKYEEQISAVDKKLCEDFNKFEQKVHDVKESPKQIYEAAKAVMNTSLQPTIEKLVTARESATQQASTLKEISLTKANEILNTKYSSLGVQGTTEDPKVVVKNLLDRYFPTVEKEVAQPAAAAVSAEEKKILQEVETVGKLPTESAKRVYDSVSAQLKTIRKEDIGEYITSVVSILHLTNFLNHGQQPLADKSVELGPEKKDDGKE